MLVPMLMPEVTSSMVIGDTPVMNRTFDAAAGASRAGLQSGEDAAVEAAAVGEVLVRLRPMVGQHGVGEVVVLVDQHVQRDVHGRRRTGTARPACWRLSMAPGYALPWSENNSRGVWRFGDLDMVAKPLQTLDVMALELLLALTVVVVLTKVVIGNSLLDDEIDDRQYLVADGYD